MLIPFTRNPAIPVGKSIRARNSTYLAGSSFFLFCLDSPVNARTFSMLSRFRWDKVNLLCFGTSNSNRMVCVNGEYPSHSSGSSFKSTKGKRILALVSNRIQSASFLLVTKVQKQKPKLLFLSNLTCRIATHWGTTLTHI